MIPDSYNAQLDFFVIDLQQGAISPSPHLRISDDVWTVAHLFAETVLQ